jgi:hypothetical protein
MSFGTDQMEKTVEEIRETVDKTMLGIKENLSPK